MTDPLHRPDLELRIIGTAFGNPEAAQAYVTDHRLEADHFTLDAHRTLWHVIDDRVRNEANLTDITFWDVLSRNPDYRIGGVADETLVRVIGDAQGNADPDATREHGVLLRDLAARRALCQAIDHAKRQAHKLDCPIDTTISTIVEASYDATLRADAPQVDHVADLFPEQHLEWQSPHPESGFSFGFRKLDDEMVLAPGTVTVIGARPSVGKSLFAQHVISHVVHRYPVNAVLVSMEMRKKELVTRITAAEARVSAKWLARDPKRPGDRSRDAEWRRIQSVGDDEALRRFGITDSADMSMVDIEALARRYRAQYPAFGLLVVDYLGLMRFADPKERPVHALSSMAQQLKVLSQKLELAVVVLCQLNRDSERERRPPRSSDLRDSGGIEQHADNVLLLHAEHSDLGDVGDRPLAANQVIIGKNRSGREGLTIDIEFDGGIPRFTDPGPPGPYRGPVPLPGDA